MHHKKPRQENEVSSIDLEPSYVPTSYYDRDISQDLKLALLNLANLKREDLRRFTFEEKMVLIDEAFYAVQQGVYKRLDILLEETNQKYGYKCRRQNSDVI